MWKLCLVFSWLKPLSCVSFGTQQQQQHFHMLMNKWIIHAFGDQKGKQRQLEIHWTYQFQLIHNKWMCLRLHNWWLTNASQTCNWTIDELEILWVTIYIKVCVISIYVYIHNTCCEMIDIIMNLVYVSWIQSWWFT